MTTEYSERGDEERAATHPGSTAPLHSKSFKLRFAFQRELGRSDVSAVKPLGLPAVVRAKFYRREGEGEVDERRAERALARVRDMFGRGPRDMYCEPVTTSHEYGWWWQWARPQTDRRLRHHIQDSAWLKERLRVLATDDGIKRRSQ
ncbi:uncharacterized protein LOC126768748 [Nymphalis io]|uniref:uncharacterized protein LOC126768748 n=1 Tax=Inachis io TaxID=171585 RepID=UPI0021696DEF|nr:uncharacterized protein LOC126768748 [Nymphalis io]XP_050342992.1 uncharacterized protein LOC126768748 [Nymphalis io]